MQLLEIKTIKELNTALLEDKDLACYIAQEVLSNEKHSTFSKTIGLFYLFYARISKKLNVNEIYTILNKSNIYFEFDNERWDFVNKLIQLYKSFKEKNE